MDELPYDWDELIARLRANGCTVGRAAVNIRRSGGIMETYLVEYRGQNHPLQVPPTSGNPTPTIVRSLCDNLGLAHEPFGLPRWH